MGQRQARAEKKVVRREHRGDPKFLIREWLQAKTHIRQLEVRQNVAHFLDDLDLGLFVELHQLDSESRLFFGLGRRRSCSRGLA